MRLREIEEALDVSNKYQVKPIDADSTHSEHINLLKRKDIHNPRKFFLKGYETDIDNDYYEDDNMVDAELYPFGKIAGFIEYAAYKVYKYLGMKIPKSVNIHFDLQQDRHQLLVSSFKNGKTFGDFPYGDVRMKDKESEIRKSGLIYAFFVGNSDLHGGNIAVKFDKNHDISDYYFFDLELSFRNIPKMIESFDYYLKIADKIDGRKRNKYMRVIKNINLKEIDYLIDGAREHAYEVIKKSIPITNLFKKAILKKWNGILAEVSKKMKANIRTNRKFLLERYPV